MTRKEYQKITKKSKIRRQIIDLKNQGKSNKEISIIMSAQANKRICEKTVSSIKSIKRKSKFATYRQYTKSLMFLHILESQTHLLNFTNTNKLRRRVSLLVKNKFPQPFSRFSLRTHKNCLNGIVKKIRSFLNNQSQQTQDYFLETQSEQQSILSPSQFIINEDQINQIQERITTDLNFY